MSSSRRRRKRREAEVAALNRQTKQQEESNRIENTPIPTREQVQELQARTSELSNAEEERMRKAREGYRGEALRDVTTRVPGLNDQAKQAMRESANKQIGGHLDNYSKMLASSQGSRGVRGGKAQADLRRQALNAQNQANTDINQLDTGLEMQRLAAYLANIEGRSVEDLLRRQQYTDYLTGEQERRRQVAYNQYFNRYFGGM